MIHTHPIYSDYGCDELGNVYSLKFNKIKKLKPAKNGKGYLIFDISYNNKQFHKRVHHFVYECITKLIPNWSNKSADGITINHIDSNRINNKIDNLEIKTLRENLQLKECNKIENKKSGLPRYVSFIKNNNINCFRVLIRLKNKLIHFGNYSTVEEAEQVAIAKHKELYPNETT
jgi:hypothetical protein